MDEFLGTYVPDPAKSAGNLIVKFDSPCGWDAQQWENLELFCFRII